MKQPNTKARFALLAAVALAMVGVLFYAAHAEAACKPSDYGCADFSERRAFPQDGKCLDFGASVNVPEGDLLNRTGDSTWYSFSAEAGTGTGIQDDQSESLCVGSLCGSGEFDGHIDSLAICPYETPFPKCGWGQGPPVYEP